VTNLNFYVGPVVELGRVSAETKGQAMFDRDTDGGKLRYVAGIVDE
jgi:hypothetical protein